MTTFNDLWVLCVITGLVRWYWREISPEFGLNKIDKDLQVKNTFIPRWLLKNLNEQKTELFFPTAVMDVLPASSQISAPATG